MAREILLHSGEFINQNDYKYKVEFYKVYDLHVVPETITFNANGGTAQVTVWSNKGSAYISDSQVEWLACTQTGSEPINGTRWYRYTYTITCSSNNTGENRSYAWGVHIEDGEGTGIASCTFTVIQTTEQPPIPTTITANPSIFSFNATGGSDITSVTYTGLAPQCSVSGSWISASYYDAPDSNVVRYIINTSSNQSGYRFGTVNFYNAGGSATVTVNQMGSGSTSINAYPDTFSFGQLGGGGMTSVYYTGLSPQYSVSGGSWLSVSLYDDTSSLARYILSVSENTGVDRFCTVNFYDNTGGSSTVSVTQEGYGTSELYVVPSSIRMPYVSSMSTVRVYCEDAFGVQYLSGSEWISCYSSAGDQSYVTYYITTTSATSTSERTGELQFYNLQHSATLNVVQDCYGQPVANPSELSFNAYGGSQFLQMIYPTSVGYSMIPGSAYSWLSYSVSSYVSDFAIINFTAQFNDTGSPRSATYDFRVLDSLTQIITIYQE